MKRVLITGASSGIGRQLALDYAADGWQVVACGRDGGKLAAALTGSAAELCVFDMLDRDHCQATLARLEPLDLVILNAGTCAYIDDVRSFDAALFAEVVANNLIGTGNCLAALTGRIRPGGRLALVSSAVTFLPLPRAEAYGASKAALDYLARSLAIDLARHAIAVSLIRPGFVDTPLTRRNDFPMPGRISVTAASRAIRRGLASGRHEICFPFTFCAALRLLACLPFGLWRRLAARMTRNPV